MKTNLTQNQLDQLGELVAFGKNVDGVLFIKHVYGNVRGDVKGNVEGNVLGEMK